MAADLTTQELGVLAVVATGDVVAPYSNVTLTRLESRRLVTHHHLRQPNGRLALSARWTITEAGRAIVEARP